METNQLSVLICGGGIAGLALGHSLIKLGGKDNFKVTLIEKDKAIETRSQGYSLTIQPNG